MQKRKAPIGGIGCFFCGELAAEIKADERLQDVIDRDKIATFHFHSHLNPDTEGNGGGYVCKKCEAILANAVTVRKKVVVVGNGGAIRLSKMALGREAIAIVMGDAEKL